MTRNTPSKSRFSLLAPMLIVGLGVALLLNNFLLLGEVNLYNLAPLLLVALGAVILLRGDVLLNNDSRRFSITRGSVESATLELNLGELDLSLAPLPDSNQERLIVGYYAQSARPQLQVRDTHATVRLDRAQLEWTSMAEWDIRLTQGMPWDIYLSTSTGQSSLDLSSLITGKVEISAGIGDLRLIAPHEQLEGGFVRVHSALGNIHLQVPEGKTAEIILHTGRFVNLRVDETRYQRTAQGYMSRPDESSTAPLGNAVLIHLSGTFSDIYIA